jgi:hypothetical protein
LDPFPFGERRVGEQLRRFTIKAGRLFLHVSRRSALTGFSSGGCAARTSVFHQMPFKAILEVDYPHGVHLLDHSSAQSDNPVFTFLLTQAGAADLFVRRERLF